jgi:GGDEF domain-containing protein
MADASLRRRRSATGLATRHQGVRLLDRDLRRIGVVACCDIDNMLEFNHANRHGVSDEC